MAPDIDHFIYVNSSNRIRSISGIRQQTTNEQRNHRANHQERHRPASNAGNSDYNRSNQRTSNINTNTAARNRNGKGTSRSRTGTAAYIHPLRKHPTASDSIRQQLNQLLAQAPEAKKPIAIEALEIGLQQAQDIDANAEEIIILQNALAAQSLKSCITYIDTINLKTTNTIQSLNLSDYAPIEWNEYTRLHQTAQPTDDYSNLEHKLAKREQLQQVITIASESLKALA
jgi:hypothetical protein